MISDKDYCLKQNFLKSKWKQDGRHIGCRRRVLLWWLQCSVVSLFSFRCSNTKQTFLKVIEHHLMVDIVLAYPAAAVSGKHKK